MNCKEKGFTLVELVVGMAIMGMVVGLGYMYFDFNLSSFNREENHAKAHQNVRLVGDYINQQLRYATEVQVLADTTSIPTVAQISGAADGDVRTDNYIYISGNTIIHRDQAGDRPLPSAALAPDATLSLAFTRQSNPSPSTANQIIQYQVSDSLTSYQITSKSHPENLGIIDISGTTGVAIRYRKPATIVNNPPISVTTNNEHLSCCT